MAFVPSIALTTRSSFVDPTTRSRAVQSHVPQSHRSNRCPPPLSPRPDRVPSPIMQSTDVKTSDIFMPALSSTMTEGKIVQWLKQPGDAVSVGEAVMVVESDKADMDVESFEKGFLAAILVEEGESCPVGDSVGIIVPNKDDIGKVDVSALSSPSPAAKGNGVTADPEPPAPAPAPAPTPSASSAPAATPIEKPPLFEIFMPALSSTMSEGKVVEWLKTEGDAVQTGDMVMVVESDKADMDVETFESGVIAHISVDSGESALVGEAVAFLAKTEADVPAVKAWALSVSAGPAPASPAASPAPVVESATPATAPPAAATPPAAEAKIVNEGRIIASPFAKVTARQEGVDLRYVVGTGPNGRIVEKDVLNAKKSDVSPAPAATPAAAAATSSPSGKVVATPNAKKVAKKEKIDLSSVKGSGNFGRITADDVLRVAGKAPAVVVKKVEVETVIAKAGTPSEKKASAAKKVDTPAGSVAMSSMQKAVVASMNASLEVPVFRLTYKIKTTQLDALYAKVKPKGVTMSALLAKAVAVTLRKHPIMNASYAEGAIVYREEINVAMAVAMPDGGLITPTLMKTDETDLYSLSRTWKDLLKRTMKKKLSPSEYSSGTFIISNLGMFGVEQFDAILPPGVPGILAVGASKPVVQLGSNGLIGVEKVMSVTLTADHRHIYGADGAKFLQDLTSLIESDVTELVM